MPEPGGAVLKFSGICNVGKAGLGHFKAAVEQLGWISIDDPKVQVCYLVKDLKAAEWQQACGGGRGLLKLFFKGDGGVTRFAGFKAEDKPAIEKHMKAHYGIQLTERPVSTAGHTWFDWELNGTTDLRLLSGDKVGLDVPLSDLSQITTPGKGDLSLEFLEDACVGPGDEVMHELRLFVPDGEMTAEQLRDELQQRAGLSATGEAIARIPDIAVVQPRGKHDFEFFHQAVKIHGKTQTYTIKVKSIARLFLLELPRDGVRALVVGLDQPLRQGQQMHSFIVLTIDEERKIKIDIPEQKLKELKMTFQQGTYHFAWQVVGDLLRKLTERSIVGPAAEFKELHPQKHYCVRCSFKTQVGFLFPLMRSIIFVTKPVIWIRYDDIEGVHFGMGQMLRSSFDIVIRVRRQAVYEFSQIERALLDPLRMFFRNRSVTIDNAEEIQNMIQGPTGRRSAKPAPPLPAAGSASRARAAPAADGEEYDEDQDEDYDGADGEETSSDAEVDEADLEEPEVPKKRPRRGGK